MKSLYGFNPELRIFQNHSPEQQVNILKSWGVDAVFGGYTDAAFVKAAHAVDLKVYAEFACFRGVDWWNTIPESRPLTADGSPLEPIDWYHGVNPSVPEVRQSLLEKLRGVLTTYPIDGVWLDFIRWPCRWEKKQPALVQTSFDSGTVQRFTQDTGVVLSDGNTSKDILTGHLDAWTDWKCEQIRSWVMQARAIVDTVRPNATLGLFGIPWTEADYDGAIRSIIGQDFKQLAPYVDVFSPMVYHRMCHQPVTWIETVTTHLSETTGQSVVPIIQSVDTPDILPAHEYREALETAQSTGDGVIVFTLEGMLSEEKLDATRQVFRIGT